MAKDTLRRRLLSIGLAAASLMLVGTVGVLIWFGPSIVNVGNLLVAICNVVVFASQRRRAQSPTG